MIIYFLFYVIILIFTGCISFEIFKKFDRSWKLRRKIPGFYDYPVFGSVFQLAQINAERQFVFDRKRNKEHGPLYAFSVFNTKVVCFMNPEDIEQILSNVKHITKSNLYNFLHNWLGTGLLTSTGSKWHNRRKILTPTFHFNILLEFLKVFNEETKNLVTVIKNESINGVIDVVPPITQFTLLSINETAMGTKLNLADSATQKYKKDIYKLGELLVKRICSPWVYIEFVYRLTRNGREHMELVKSLHSVSKHVIKERAENFSGEDLLLKQENASYSTKKRLAMLDLLLSAKQEGAIDDEGIREEVDTFMFEGHDTTSMAICFALFEIANHKTMQETIYQEIRDVLGDESGDPTYKELTELKYLERFIKEVLRLYPSVPFISRICGEEFVSHKGYVIPKDFELDIHIYDLHRDPNIYPDPEKFDPDRFLPENCKNRHPFAYIPFSAGPRNCIGQKFAMLELKAVLVGILREFILEPVSKHGNIVYLTDLVLRPNEKGIKVKFLPRSN